MLAESDVIRYIQLHLGFPYKSTEHSTETILEHLRIHALPLFSSFVPDVAFKGFGEEDKVVGTPNLYLLNDDDGCDVLTVRDVTSSLTDSFMTGHPWTFMSSWDSLLGTELNILQSKMVNQMSVTNKTWEFIPPNKLFIYSQRFISPFMVRYERVHPPTFTTIPSQFQATFLDLCLSDAFTLFADIRGQYQEIATPWGSIPLGVDMLRSEADRIRTEVIEKLSSLPPNIILEVR